MWNSYEHHAERDHERPDERPGKGVDLIVSRGSSRVSSHHSSSYYNGSIADTGSEIGGTDWNDSTSNLGEYSWADGSQESLALEVSKNP